MDYNHLPADLVDAVTAAGDQWADGIGDVDDSAPKRMLEAMSIVHDASTHGLAFDNPETVLALGDDWLTDFDGDDAVEWIAARVLTPSLACDLEAAGVTADQLMDGDEPRRNSHGVPIGLLLTSEQIGVDDPLVVG